MTSVLLIIFNRPATTQLVFNAIRLAQPSRLYIAADGPRHINTNDKEKSNLTRAVTENVDWPCEVKRLYQKENLGCSLGPRVAFDWFFSFENEGIILEDDCVPNLDFFTFTSEMLVRYRDNNRIISINGSNLGYKLNNGDSYSYSRFMNMWGWATWRRSYEKIDYNLSNWRQLKNKELYLWRKLRVNFFDIDIAWIKYWRFQFDKSISDEKITWWDYQWIYHQLFHNQYSVVPCNNLVTNIGFNESGNHTLHPDSPASNIPQKCLNVIDLQHPSVIKPDFVYEKYFIKKVWSYYTKISLIKTLRYLLMAVIKYFVIIFSNSSDSK
jgi:hypothetical protein